MPTATAMPPRCAAGSAASSPVSMRASARPGAPALWRAICAPISMSMPARAAPASTASSSAPTRAGRLGAFNVRGGASYSLDSIDTSRAIVFPGFTDKTSARFHGNVGQVFGEVGYGMAFGQVAVEPLAGLAYVHVRDGSFLESGGVAALSGSSANENTGYSFLGVRAATFVPLANGTMLVPRGTLQWQHAFGDVTPGCGAGVPGHGGGVLGCRHPDRARHRAGGRRLRLALCPAGQARRVLSGRTRRARADPCGQRRLHLGFLTITASTVYVIDPVHDIDHDQRRWFGRHQVCQCHHQSGLSHAVAQLYRQRCNPDAGNGSGRHR